jgi:hypothetical protein
MAWNGIRLSLEAECYATVVSVFASGNPLFDTHSGRAVDYKSRNRPGHASESGTDAILRVYVYRTLHQNRRDVGNDTFFYSVPGGSNLHHWSTGTAWGDRRVDCRSSEVDGDLSDLDAPVSFTSEHLFGKKSRRFRRSRRWSDLFEACRIKLIIINSIRSAPEEPDVYSVDGNIFFKLRRSDL